MAYDTPPGLADELLHKSVQLIAVSKDDIRSSSAILAETRERVEQTQRRLEITERLLRTLIVSGFGPRA